MTVSDWHRLVARSSLTKPEKHLALTMATYASYRTGADIYPGNRKLARAIGYSKPDLVGPHMQSLRRKGWVVQVKPANEERGRVARYTLSVPLDADTQLIYGPEAV
ncbi:hypothetical protein [Gordonia sp. MP11Mi]